MSAGDAIRALADSGTPSGQWSAHEGDLEGGTLVDYVSTLFRNRDDGTSTGRLFLTLAPNVVDPEKGEQIVPAMTGDGPASEANACKIVAAVNALRPLAEFADAFDEWLEADDDWRAKFKVVLGRWDELVAALGVTE